MDILIKEMDYEKKLALILNIKQIFIRLLLVLNSLSLPPPLPPPLPWQTTESGSGIVKYNMDN